MNKNVETQNDILKVGVEEGLIRIQNDQIEYIAQKKIYNYADPEEKIRAIAYVKLILKYKYPANRINLEVYPPRREPKLPADIVVYEDDELAHTYVAVEVKPTSSGSDIEVAKREGLGNANLLNAPYLLLSCGDIELAYNLEKGPSLEALEKFRIPSMPTFYGKVPQYRYKKGAGAFFDLSKASLNELISRFQICHDDIWEGGKRDPAESFDEMSKLMFAKFYDERFTKTGEYYRCQIGTYENPYIIAKRVKEIYKEVQEKEPNVFRKPIEVPDYIIFKVVEALQDISLKETDLDAKGRAYESFLGKVFRGEFGQFFTPREIVDFMVKMVGPTEKDLVMDPACGSGGFLLYSIAHVRDKIRENYVGDEKAIIRLDYDFSHYNVFGIEINDRIARVSMMDMVIHDDGHSNIECNDALRDYTDFDPRRDIRPNKYHLVLTNPPFGAVEERQVILKLFELGSKIKRRKKQKKEILFIERSLELLKPDGILGIVVPDGILNNPSLKYVREFIRKQATIEAVVSLTQDAFKPFGAGDKTSILFLRKKGTERSRGRVFMAIAEYIGYDATGQKIDENYLTRIREQYERHKKGLDIEPAESYVLKTWNFKPKGVETFIVKEKDLEDRLDPFYYHPIHTKNEEELMDFYETKTIEDIAEEPVKGRAPREYVKAGVPVLTIVDITKDGKLDLSGVKYITKEEHEKARQSQLKPNDLLLAVTGATIGKVTVVPEALGDCNICGDIVRLTISDENINPKFVAEILRSKFGQLQIQRYISGSTNKHLSPGDIKRTKIPVPSREIQDEIVKKIEEAEAEADKLRKKADEIVQKVRAKIPMLKSVKAL